MIRGRVGNHGIASPVGMNTRLVLDLDVTRARSGNQHVGITQWLAKGDAIPVSYDAAAQTVVHLLVVAVSAVVIAHVRIAIGAIVFKAAGAL